jgi:hypothetical protein
LFSHVVNTVVFLCSTSYLLYLNFPLETDNKPEEKCLLVVVAVTIPREIRRPRKTTRNIERKGGRDTVKDAVFRDVSPCGVRLEPTFQKNMSPSSSG